MVIHLFGDIALNGLFVYDPEININRIEKLTQHFNVSSCALANLEVPVKGRFAEVNPDKNKHFYTTADAIKKVLPLLKVRVVSLANNHIGDYGISGVQNTIDVLDEIKILHTGTGIKKEHIEPVILELNGEKLAFLAYVDQSTNPKCDNIQNLLINYFNEEKVISDIIAIKSFANKIILSIHWGIDYSYYPINNQVRIARNLIDAGADIIMGHHPHTLQPFEKYKSGYIFYSLGGLTFGDHYQNGVLKALPRKTKFSAVPILNIGTELKLEKVISTKESKGNYIRLTNKNLFKWSDRRWFIYRLKRKHQIIDKLVFFKANYLDRIYEFLFGYYKNPIKRIFELFDIKRIKKMHRDAEINKDRVV